MAIETYEFGKLTTVIKDIFPVKKCNQLSCQFNFNSFGKYFNMASGLLSGNDYVLKQVKTLGRGDRDGVGGDSSFADENAYDFTSPSKFLYYNTDIKYPVYN
jgi:hypothetical protein